MKCKTKTINYTSSHPPKYLVEASLVALILCGLVFLHVNTAFPPVSFRKTAQPMSMGTLSEQSVTNSLLDLTSLMRSLYQHSLL